MTMTDETLMAFLDGELTAGDMAKVAAQIEDSPRLARHVENMRLGDKLFTRSCHSIDSRPMPREIIAMLDGFPENRARQANHNGATILPFRQKLRELSSAPLWQMAVAATVVLVVGLGAGRSLLAPPADIAPGMIQARNTADIIGSDNALFAVLEQQPSASSITINIARDAVVTPTMTFRSANNGYCREYMVMSGQSGTRNIACRGENAWTVKASVTIQGDISPAEGQYQTATGQDNSALDSMILGLIEGDALSREQESEIMQRNWQLK